MIPEKVIVFTLDTDWAPAFVVEDVIELLKDTPATFCVTDKNARDVLAQKPNIELGIHPNFMPGSTHGKTRQEVMETMMQLVPEAKTVRSHNLFQDTTVLDLYIEFGMTQDVSLIEYGNPGIRLFRYWNGLVRVPFNVDDSVSLIRSEDLAIQDWMLSAPLLICTFHPIHIFLNTDRLKRYTDLRDRGSLSAMMPAEILPFVNRDKPGARDLLISLLEQVSQGLRTPMTIAELAKDFPVAEYCSLPKPGHLSTRQATFHKKVS